MQFKRGRGCVDMIFTARQLLEKTREEHDDVLFVFYKERMTPCQDLPCGVLEKCGLPPTVMSIAKVRVGTATLNSFEVKNGLRQGRTLFLTSILVPRFLFEDTSARRSELAFVTRMAES